MADSAPDTLAAQALAFLFEGLGDSSALLGGESLRERSLEAARLSTWPLGTSTLFLELPLTGAPRFDLHVYPEILHGQQRCAQHEQAVSRHWPRHEGLFAWCAQQPAGVAEAGYAFDLSSNADALDDPCLYTAFFDKDKSAVIPSMAHMDGARFEPRLRRILDALLPGMHVYYTGVMHGRDPVVAHLGYKVGERLARAYEDDPSALASHLAKQGFSLGRDDLEGFQDLAGLGFASDIQFAFDEQGVTDDTLAFSYAENGGFTQGAQSFRDGNMRKVLEHLRDEGLADDRWRLLDPVMGVRRMPCYLDGALHMAAVAASIGYVKVRFADGVPCAPAKAYVMLKSVIVE